MTTHYPQQDYSIQPVNHTSPSQQQAHRRQLLGALLVGVGGLWFYLRLTNQIGDVFMPICWVGGPSAILHHFSIGCDAPSLPQIAYGMLTAFTIHYPQRSYAE